MAEYHLATVLEALDYAGTEGLVTTATPAVSPARQHIWREVQEKFGLQAAYFHGDIPVVYFRGIAAAENVNLLELHRHLWNHNRAPLFVAILPDEIRVYNCFSPPSNHPVRADDPGTSLLESVSAVADILSLRASLSPFARGEVESGRFARQHPTLFKRAHRVDRQLLSNLAYLRNILTANESGLTEHVANNLIGRSIFVRYLEDRGVLTPEFFGQFGGAKYSDLLLGRQSARQTYALFDMLSARFNGDMFPIGDDERAQTTDAQLEALGRFLQGTSMGSGQTSFWQYEFNYIPIELISAIYEQFLHQQQASTGAYYTPVELVEFVLNQVLSWDGHATDVTILDPACGSGAFLVQAYRRLIERERRLNPGQRIPPQRLIDILKTSIHGVDINPDAISVAAFSCYLALLDHIEPKSIWTDIRLPRLRGENLFEADFFDPHAPFNHRAYSLILGNPPWQSALGHQAQAYVHRSTHTIGDQQIAQAFLWRAADLISDDGSVCMLVPSKSLLFNQSDPSRKFRQQFFQTLAVTAIVNFSAFRRTMFQNATAPMAAVFYQRPTSSQQAQSSGLLFYCTPRPSPLLEQIAGFTIASDQVQTFSRREVAVRSEIWKIAMWGTARDHKFIDSLRARFPTLQDIARERGWVIGQGVQIHGSGSHVDAPELNRIAYVAPDQLMPFKYHTQPNIGATRFRRKGDSRIYKAPHLLIRRVVLRDGIIAVAYVPEDTVFTDSIIAISSPPEHVDALKAVCAFISSSLARYYHFLTSSSWGVERDKVHQQEHLMLPCPIAALDSELIHQLARMVDNMHGEESPEHLRAELDELVLAAYGVTAVERQIIADTLDFTYDEFRRGARSAVFEEPSEPQLVAYAKTFAETLNASIGYRSSRFHPIVYEGSAPFRAVSFALSESASVNEPSGITHRPGLIDELRRLEQAVLSDGIQNLYLQRSIKVFGANSVHIVKPNERRQWTGLAALNDADATIQTLLAAAPRG